MPPSNRQTKRSKFTRGEKCLFVHLIITFAVIILMTLTYFVHLCFVKHTRNEMLKIYRRTDNGLSGIDVSDFECIGVVYINVMPVRVVCNTLLLQERWSLAPAQCTSMRDDPDMSPYLLQWKIRYKISGKHLHSNIKRTLTHSQFNRDDYHNNIGLFEHASPIYNDAYYVAPNNIIVDEEMLHKNAKDMAIVNWELGYSNKGDVANANVVRVRPVPSDKCSTYASPIVQQLRSYEFCINFDHNGPTADHGAMVVINSKIIGYFSWGDIRGRGVPLIILNIIHFREWFESIINNAF